MDDKLTAALKMLVLTPHINQYLAQYDLNALEQALAALRDTLPLEEREELELGLARADKNYQAFMNYAPTADRMVYAVTRNADIIRNWAKNRRY
jgi:hypothetical protein